MPRPWPPNCWPGSAWRRTCTTGPRASIRASASGWRSRALVTRPRLVVADEPTSRLDGSALRMVLELWTACQREQGTAFVITTRDQRQLVRASRTLQLSDGRIGARQADLPRHYPRTASSYATRVGA